MNRIGKKFDDESPINIVFQSNSWFRPLFKSILVQDDDPKLISQGSMDSSPLVENEPESTEEKGISPNDTLRLGVDEVIRTIEERKPEAAAKLEEERKAAEAAAALAEAVRFEAEAAAKLEEERKAAEAAAALAEAMRSEAEAAATLEKQRKAAEAAAALVEAMRLEAEAASKLEEERKAAAAASELEEERKAAEAAAALSEAMRLEVEAEVEEWRAAKEEVSSVEMLLAALEAGSSTTGADLSVVQSRYSGAGNGASYSESRRFIYFEKLFLPEYLSPDIGPADENAVLSLGIHNALMSGPDGTGPVDQYSLGNNPNVFKLISGKLRIPEIMEWASDAIKRNFAFLHKNLNEVETVSNATMVDLFNDIVIGTTAPSISKDSIRGTADPFSTAVMVDFLSRSYEAPTFILLRDTLSPPLPLPPSEEDEKLVDNDHKLWWFLYHGKKMGKEIIRKIRDLERKSKTMEVELLSSSNDGKMAEMVDMVDGGIPTSGQDVKLRINKETASSPNSDLQLSIGQRTDLHSQVIDAEIDTQNTSATPRTGIFDFARTRFLKLTLPIEYAVSRIDSALRNNIIMDTIRENRQALSAINSTVEELSRLDDDVLRNLIANLEKEPPSPVNRFALKALNSLERKFDRLEERLQSVTRDFEEIEKEWGVEAEQDVTGGFPEYILLIYELLDDAFPVS